MVSRRYRFVVRENVEIVKSIGSLYLNILEGRYFIITEKYSERETYSRREIEHKL